MPNETAPDGTPFCSFLPASCPIRGREAGLLGEAHMLGFIGFSENAPL